MTYRIKFYRSNISYQPKMSSLYRRARKAKRFKQPLPGRARKAKRSNDHCPEGQEIEQPFATGSKIQKSWNLEFRTSQIMKSGFYCTKMKQINSRKLLNLLFKYIVAINDPKITIIIPMSFLWSSYDFPNISYQPKMASLGFPYYRLIDIILG